MIIQFVSDLHLEFIENRLYLDKNPLSVVGDVLLIAGDTAYLDKPESGEDTYRQYGIGRRTTTSRWLSAWEITNFTAIMTSPQCRMGIG